MNNSINAFLDRFPDEDACYSYLFDQRWPSGFRCPRCGCQECYPIRKRNHYQCKGCRHQTSLAAGTIFQHSHVSLQKWFLAIHLISAGTIECSVTALQRHLGVSYPTASSMFTKIRDAIYAEQEPALFGKIQFDRCFFGSNTSHGGNARKTWR